MIIGKLSGDSEVLLRLKSMSVRVQSALRAEIQRQAIALTRYVKETKLSGQVLKNRTGTLRRKINYEITDSETAVTASVGVKLSYAAAHEYGFDGVVTVRDHVRAVKSRNARGQIDGKRRTIAQGVAFVHTYQRHMHLPERSYLRSSLRENSASIREALRGAVAEAVSS